MKCNQNHRRESLHSSGHKILRAFSPLLLGALILPATGCGLAFSKTGFLDATAEGTLKRGQTPEQVRDIVGKPHSTQSTLAGDVPVDIWTYKQTNHRDKSHYVTMTFLTFGLLGLVPVEASEEHYIVFLDGKVISWDSLPLPQSNQAGQLSAKSERRPSEETPREPIEMAGTGFYVGRDYILTNNHLIAGRPNVTIYQQGQSLPASVILRDKANDLALLKLGEDPTRKMGMHLEGPPSLTELRLGDSSKVKQGDHVWTLGFPLSVVLGGKLVLSEGAISSLYGPGEDPRLFQISVPIQPGNSGGPLFNVQGEVIGITVSTLDVLGVFQITGAIPQNVNFAVKANYARQLLSMLPDFVLPFSAIPDNASSAISLSSLAEMARPHVVLIKAAQQGK